MRVFGNEDIVLGGHPRWAWKLSASATASFTSESSGSVDSLPEAQSGSPAQGLPISDFLGPFLLPTSATTVFPWAS